MANVVDKAKLQVVVTQPPPRSQTGYLSAPAIPGLSRWEQEMLRLGSKWCNPSQVFSFGDESQVWYYDGARIYYQIADYTKGGNWNACAINIARQYRDYILQNNGYLPGWRVHPHGLLMAWQRTGDASYKTALDLLARNSANAQKGGSIHFNGMRETAYALQAYIAAEKAGLGRSQWLDKAAASLIGHFAEVFLPPMTINKPFGYHQTFIDGLGAAALIEYYEPYGRPSHCSSD